MSAKLLCYCAVVALAASAKTSEDDRLAINPEEYGEHFEGDMLLNKVDLRSGVRPALRWPQKTVVYWIDGNFNYPQRDLISQAMSEISNRTRCIKFRIATRADRAVVSISKDKPGCFSTVGRTGGIQILNLAPGCFTNGFGTIAHEIIHALGFHHEQSRSDRDNFVRIDYGNIKEGRDGNFLKYSSSQANAFGLPYDYGSIMHYSRNAWSKNNNPTIRSKKPGLDRDMGQRKGLSDLDVLKIRKMYGC